MSASTPDESKLISQFWEAICADDLETVTALLDTDSSLASKDCRPPEEQDAHTHGFPLVQAAKNGNLQIVELLLQLGADPDARSPGEDQRELGMAMQAAIENKNYDLANLLLDQGASVDGYPYCDRPTIETLYYQAIEAGASPDIACPAFESYLGADATADLQLSEVTEASPAAIRLFDRFLAAGGQPTLASIIRTERLGLLEKFLRKCPGKPTPPLDYPPASVFEKIAYAASWFGYPQVVRLAMETCPDHYNGDVARGALDNAIVSHNRDGSWQEYHELMKSQLDYLQEIGELDALRDSGEFQPHYMLAEHYCWPRNYGYKAGVSTPEGLIAIAQLFLDYGFDNLAYRDAKSGLTAIEKAKSREGHPGMREYVEFLLEKGAAE